MANPIGIDLNPLNSDEWLFILKGPRGTSTAAGDSEVDGAGDERWESDRVSDTIQEIVL